MILAKSGPSEVSQQFNAFANEMLPQIKPNQSSSSIDASSSALEVRRSEDKMAQKFVEKYKKIYSKKHDLGPFNVYERLFSYINAKLLYEVELSKQKRRFTQDARNYDSKLYQDLYTEFSNSLVQKLKRGKGKSVRQSTEQISFIKKLNPDEIAATADKIEQRNQNQKELKTRVYDYDPCMKQRVIERRRKNDFDREINKLLVSQKKAYKNNPHKHLTFSKGDGSDGNPNESYTKSAYLASLNFNFTNPLD